MEEPPKHDAKRDKPETKGRTWDDSIYRECAEQVNPQWQAQIGGCLAEWGKAEQLLTWRGLSFWDSASVLELDGAKVGEHHECIKAHWITQTGEISIQENV
jgi:hypothetical protein